MNRVDEMALGSPYQGYSYAYPHKTAYRRFDEPLPLGKLWEAEDRSALFLYVHLPFCEMRCGFCNLFTQSQPKGGLVGRYLDALEREVDRLVPALGTATFSRCALGGGTPTFLSIAELERVLALVRRVGVADVPVGIETSPATAEPEKLAMLREWGATRVSIGIQSFHDREVAQVARPQTRAAVESALGRLKDARFPALNLDLIYGLPGQTEETWTSSLEMALAYEPEELFLYPLYVRPLTGLGKSNRSWDDERLALYRSGRDLLLNAGYEQVSMRFFRRPRPQVDGGPKYCCQDDGMVGLGCGARSYAAAVHYSREYAVAASGILAILSDYIDGPADAFAHASFGFQLDADERRRRYALQSLLQSSGLDLAAYRQRFGTDAEVDFPELGELDRLHLTTHHEDRLALTAAGLERSDAIGPWLYSPRVRERMATYEAAMTVRLSILYRGPLSSCNYDCSYCPFAKREESAAELAVDRAALERFVAWAEAQSSFDLGVFFTPWGEALVRPWYRDALARLSHCGHVRRAVIQTNLSCSLAWIDRCDKTRLALWTTYHPEQTTRRRFLAQCRALLDRGVRFSVGVVGLRERRDEIAALRAELPADVYLWINAYKDVPDYYSPEEIERLTSIDAHFPINARRHPSAGRPCRTGESVVSVDGAGVVRRCHFIREPLGNLYDGSFPGLLKPRPCTNETCGCFIGYVHLEDLELERVFGDGALERIPSK